MPGQEGGAKSPLLPSLVDAHADLLLQIGIDPSESQVAVVAQMTQHDTNPSAMRNKNVNCPVLKAFKMFHFQGQWVKCPLPNF